MSGVHLRGLGWSQSELAERVFRRERIEYVVLQSMQVEFVVKGGLRDVDRAFSVFDREFGIRIKRSGMTATATPAWPEFSIAPSHAMTGSAFLGLLDSESPVARGFVAQVQGKLREGDLIGSYRYSLHPYITEGQKLTQVIEGEVQIVGRDKMSIPVLWYRSSEGR